MRSNPLLSLPRIGTNGGVYYEVKQFLQSSQTEKKCTFHAYFLFNLIRNVVKVTLYYNTQRVPTSHDHKGKKMMKYIVNV